MHRRTRLITLTATVALAGVVTAAGIATATNDPAANPQDAQPTSASTPPDDDRLTDEGDRPLLLPATPGDLPVVFSGGVSAIGTSSAEGGADIQLTQRDGLYCVDVLFPGIRGDACATLEQVQTGVAYGAWAGPDGVVHIVGIAPDDAATVSVAGETVEVSNNLWYYAGTVGQDLSFSVASADGSSTAQVR